MADSSGPSSVGNGMKGTLADSSVTPVAHHVVPASLPGSSGGVSLRLPEGETSAADGVQTPDVKREAVTPSYEQIAAKRFKAAMEGGKVVQAQCVASAGGDTMHVPAVADVVENVQSLFRMPKAMQTRHAPGSAGRTSVEDEQERAFQRYMTTVERLNDIFGLPRTSPAQPQTAASETSAQDSPKESGSGTKVGDDVLGMLRDFSEKLEAHSTHADGQNGSHPDFERKISAIEQLIKRMDNAASVEEENLIRLQFESQMNVEFRPLPPLISQRRIEPRTSHEKPDESSSTEPPLRLIKL